ncbi:MAG: uroporphyrinogen-III C-methyltransferase [Rhizobiales bacterium]|nr:uroporphyrinogen-III C-methyltransferase [Hyphomicrobiales bacterium]
MEQLPVFYNLKGRKVVITGGGTVAARRTEISLRSGAQVTVFADVLGDEFSEFQGRADFAHETRPAVLEDLADAAMAFGASEDQAIDGALYELTRAAGVPANIADVPEQCDFIMASIVDRSPLVIAVSSSGTAPILARMIRARLETMLPASYGRLAEFAGRFRDLVTERLESGMARRKFWERAIYGPTADLVLAGDEARAEEQLRSELDAVLKEGQGQPIGQVFLVGAGPGDPDLLTFRALRLMQLADVVVHDRLIGDGVLNLVRRDAERVYVGKRPRDHTLPQEEISQLLVRLAKEGKRVLRLKGGDPFIFGRGGEEIETLAVEGIPFQVVPGITAASGCASYAGIPLTHRDHAQSCVFVTAHGRDGVIDLDWTSLLRPRQTVAIYMGLTSLDRVAGEFIARGADTSLPAAVIDNGTRANQQVVAGTLGTIASDAVAAELKGPALVIIGSVVSLREKLQWFEGERSTSNLAERSISTDLLI